MQIDRRGFTLGALAGAASLSACSIGGAGEMPQAKNFMLLMVDDLNDWVTALGDHPQVTTPHMDKLGASGTVFANAHAQAPICGPSRASLFSGLYPAQTGIYGQISDAQLGPAVSAVSPTLLLPQHLRSQGYYAAGRGKVSHQGGQEGMFDEYHARAEKNGHYGPKPEEPFKWSDPRTNTDWGAYPDTDEEMIDFVTATWGAEFLHKDHDQPFMLALGFVRPHVPWYVPKAWLDKFPLDEIEMPAVLDSDFDDIPQAGKDLAAVPQMPTLEWARENEEWRPIMQAYLASIAFVDHCVGIAMQALEDSGRVDDTLVCLMSDNGYHLGEKQRFAKMSLWGRSTRVPLMFSGPGIQSQVIADPVGLIDIYPTVLDMLDLPANPENSGTNLAPILTGTGTIAFEPQISVYGRGNWAVIDQRYRYIQYADGSEELYDLREDPREWNNIAGDENLSGVKRRLAAYIPNEAAADVMK